MALPFIIEYLVAQEHPGGGRLVYQGAESIVIPIFPPNTTITVISTPVEGVYCQIDFVAYVGTAVVPGAFSAILLQAGARPVDATIGTSAIGRELNFFIPYTDSLPFISSVTNETALNQYYEVLFQHIAISTKDDYERVVQDVERLGRSATSEQLQVEANSLLLRLLEVSKPQPVYPFPPRRES